MPQKLTASEVISEIEFELAHGSLSHDELGQAIESIRQYQNKTRTELLSRRNIDSAEAARRLFQMNDMLLAAMHQMAINLKAQQQEQRDLAEWVRSNAGNLEPLPTNAAHAMMAPGMPAARPSTHAQQQYPAKPATLNHLSPAIQDMMRLASLKVQNEVRPVNTPVIGQLLTRVRSMLHDIAVFYAGKLGKQQTAFNMAITDAVVQLNAQQEQLASRIEPQD